MVERFEADGGPSVPGPFSGQFDEVWVLVEQRLLFVDWQLEGDRTADLEVGDDLSVDADIDLSMM